tara:strand:- start:7482 stop:8711 length:1230 start_codon:yes stop_codon:yes gene_type:complete
MNSVDEKSCAERSRSIPEGWVETTLEDSVTKLGDGLHGTPKYSDDGEYFFINGNNLNDGKIEIKKETKRCSNEEFEKYKKNLNSRTILVSINGSLGYFAYYNNEKCFLGKSACYFNVKESISKRFIGYQIRTKYFQKYIERLAGGTTIKNVSLKTMREFPFIIPKELEEQKAIAKVLTAFDDKIENLNAQNHTLEQTAQTIFKEWFGKYQIDDELPEGWRVGKLSEIANFLNGLALQKYPPKIGQETLPVIKIRELKQGITSQTDKANTELDEKYIIDNGDILFSWSGSLEVVIWQHGKGALNQHLFKVTSEVYPKWFYYYWIIHHLNNFRGIASSKATTMGHINRKHLDLAEVIIPNEEAFKDLNHLFNPLIKKLELNNSQIQTLTKTRDTLLPKLMRGELRVNGFKK